MRRSSSTAEENVYRALKNYVESGGRRFVSAEIGLESEIWTESERERIESLWHIHRKGRRTMENIKGIKWPEGKQSAVMFTFDVDGDTTWENGNRGLPGGEKYIKSLSVGQYGPKRCVDRILDKLNQYGVKGDFFVPGLTAERYPEVIERIAAEGHEIGHHGYAHERFAGQTVEQQIEIIEKTQKIFKQLIGHEVTGFRTPSGDWSVETPRLLRKRIPAIPAP